MTNFTKIARKIKNGISMAGLNAAILTGLGAVMEPIFNIADSGSINLDQGTLSCIAGGAVVGLAVSSAITSKQLFDKYKAYSLNKKIRNNDYSYEVHGNLSKEKSFMTVYDSKESTRDFMFMKKVKTDPVTPTSPEYTIRATFSPTVTDEGFNNLLSIAQRFSRENNASLELPRCEQSLQKIFHAMEINQGGKILHMPLTESQSIKVENENDKNVEVFGTNVFQQNRPKIDNVMYETNEGASSYPYIYDERNKNFQEAKFEKGELDYSPAM